MGNLQSKERRRLERGIILQLLVHDTNEWTAFQSLVRMMDMRGYPVSNDGLTFHLGRYMQPKGYVALRRARDVEHCPEGIHPDKILFVQIAPDGLNVVNRSTKDSEVVI